MNPAEAMTKLDGYASELDTLSKQLADTERTLAPLEDAMGTFIDDYETGLWESHVQDDAKLPSAGMRLKLARKHLPAELLGKVTTLQASRRRMEKRIATLKGLVDAQRSILSALKSEAEAAGVGLRRAA